MTDVTTTSQTISTGIAVIIRGIVGSGKTTFTERLRRTLLRKYPELCILVVSMDDLAVIARLTGKPYSHPRFEKEISGRILAFSKRRDVPKLLIIDSCGVTGANPSEKIFGHYLEGWPRTVVQPNKTANSDYLHWSLFNVLNRKSARAAHAAGEVPSNLNPTDSGYETCVGVHTGKGRQLDGTSFQTPLPAILPPIREAIEILRPGAERYLAFLSEKVPGTEMSRSECCVINAACQIERIAKEMGIL